MIFKKKHENQLSHITKKLSELKSLIMKSKTYADAAAMGTHRETTSNQETSLNHRNPCSSSSVVNYTREIQQHNLQHKVQQHHERNKLKIILIIQEMNPDIKK